MSMGRGGKALGRWLWWEPGSPRSLFQLLHLMGAGNRAHSLAALLPALFSIIAQVQLRSLLLCFFFLLFVLAVSKKT